MFLMSDGKCDILIVGGGTGGFAAALMACDLGHSVILTEETDWLGGQLTTQIVPPDEHPWIEEFGCTRRYREYRDRVRQWYRDAKILTPEAASDPHINPGGGWVSKLCHEPVYGGDAFGEMLFEHIRSGTLQLHFFRKPHSVEVVDDRIRSVRFYNFKTKRFDIFTGTVVLDATELGDLLALSGTEYVVGAESKDETGEPNAIDGPAEWDNVQGLTWCFALGSDATKERRIEKPDQYEKWKNWKPDFWPGPILGFKVLHAHTGVEIDLPLYGQNPEDWYALFPYRQIVDPEKLIEKADPVTVVNWPQNDYFEATIIDVDPLPVGDEIPEGFGVPGAMGPISAARLNDAKQLSLSLLYWLQNDAPRHDGRPGAYPHLYIDKRVTATPDGFAKYPYIRESRRIKALYTVREQEVAAYTNEGLDRAPSFRDSVGIGAYRIDLHPSTSGRNMIDTSTIPFEIPLGALIPIRMKNLIPACKNIGTTHITNGCYRLHPLEWNIGEAAAAIASLALKHGVSVQDIPPRYEELATVLVQQGVELHWPADAELRAL